MILFQKLRGWLLGNGTNVPPTRLVTLRLILRPSTVTDYAEWRRVREGNRTFLTPWEPLWQDASFTQRGFQSICRRGWRDWQAGRAFCFLIFLKKVDERESDLIGGINLHDIVRGIAHRGTLGYWMAEAHTRKGYMTEAAGAVCDFAFNHAGLHRVEASCMPGNHASRMVLEHLNFIEEGFAKAYLRINGKWEDHILWGKSLG
jgi:ribosomal-protein-alanine N-acetyltransferase